jgi:hypothetical protein
MRGVPMREYLLKPIDRVLHRQLLISLLGHWPVGSARLRGTRSLQTR